MAPCSCSIGVLITACRNGFSVRSNSRIGSIGLTRTGLGTIDAMNWRAAAICTAVPQTCGTMRMP
ncbi:hypothetical protein D3C72_2588930 [compost metagenome]